MHLVVLGSGAMGLAAAYQALVDGHEVTVLEADSQPGGMAAHFDFGGLSIERYYHFICKTDYPTFELMRELGMEDKLRWRDTSMGLFTGGKLHPWGNPVALLTFPDMGWIDKLRYGLFAFVSARRNRWPSLEHRTAKEWITTWCGENVYKLHWEPLFQHKFYEFQDNISASWIWTRIRRIGRSRKSLMQEQLGYVDGGTETLVHALVEKIEAMGGTILLGNPATSVVTEGGEVTGVLTAKGLIAVYFAAHSRPFAGSEGAVRCDPEHRYLLPDLQAEAVLDAALLVESVGPAYRDTGHDRVLEPAPGRRPRCICSVLHADHECEVQLER
jgi:protoporphyrinogen oxidase